MRQPHADDASEPDHEDHPLPVRPRPHVDPATVGGPHFIERTGHPYFRDGSGRTLTLKPGNGVVIVHPQPPGIQIYGSDVARLIGNEFARIADLADEQARRNERVASSLLDWATRTDIEGGDRSE